MKKHPIRLQKVDIEPSSLREQVVQQCPKLLKLLQVNVPGGEKSKLIGKLFETDTINL